MLFIPLLLSIAGIVVSAYTLYIEHQVKANASYKATCDINDRMSCTKPILSPYGKLFGISNSIVGIFFYSVVAVFALLNAKILVLLAAIAACLMSVFLAYILYFKIKSVCILCTTIYLINILLLVSSLINR